MTVHTIEQVCKINVDFFRCLVDAAPNVIGLHLEPVGFQATPDLGPVTKKQVEYFKQYGWNVNFYEMLNQARDEGLVEIDFVETDLFFSGDPHN